MPVRWRRAAALALFCYLPLCAEIRSLSILHVNDLHSHISPGDNHMGGFAYLAAAIREERANCHDCILLNAGDVAQGTPVSTIFHGLPVFEIANLLGFDASTLGNHEFDYGWMQARKFIQTAKYPVVSANVLDPQGKLFAPKPYVILDVNGLRVAVIGAMTEDLHSLTTPITLGECRTLALVETVRRYARELHETSDLIVLLAHISPAEETTVLESVTEIPVVVSGHLHRGMDQPIVKDGRMLVRAKGNAEELCRLDLKVDTEKKAPVSWNWKKIGIDSTRIAAAPDVAAAVKHWEDEVTARVDRPLAVSHRALTKPELKKLIERALREETGSDFAWMNQGGVRDTLPEGQLRERHIWQIMPFDNVVVVGTFKGRDLPKVVVGDRQIDPDHEYTLAVSDFTAANQDTRENLQTTGLKFPHELGIMRDLLIDWFRKMRVIE
jgi:2',3'-cyclic-nucleotide 2'-phosphodiesterase (5'-nucleotidase family)